MRTGTRRSDLPGLLVLLFALGGMSDGSRGPHTDHKGQAGMSDPRNIRTGYTIPDEGCSENAP